MYLGVDVGGTKTLLAVFSKDGKILKQQKFSTSQDYQQFINDLKQKIISLGGDEISGACIGMPGLIDHKTGTSIDAGGNLPWKNVSVKKGVEDILPNCKVLIHNDAKLAGLSEALLLTKKYKKILYLTLSTGIGGAVITNGMIDSNFINFEPGRMPLEHENKVKRWEEFASGKAFYHKYGLLASEANDPKIWKEHSKLLALGLDAVLANVQPDIVIIGGGMGAHLEKFKPFLQAELKVMQDPLVPLPPIEKAKRPEEAVIYGCYDYIKQNA